MKIAYLMHSERGYDEVIESVNQLIKQQDHVFLMINDNDLREKISFVYADEKRVHISHTQEFAQQGDLSLARGTIIQMKEAIELGGFDYFINLTDGMMPIKSRNEIVAFLEENDGKDFYYVDRSEKEDTNLRPKSEKFYTLTNLIAFPTSKFIRSSCRGIASILNVLGVKRKLKDTYVIGSPWFMISRKTAMILSENFSYVAATFKLSWYPEEMYIPMMMNRFVYTNGEDLHINKDYRVVGPEGKWCESSDALAIKKEIIEQHPEAMFASKITLDDNFDLYQEYFDKYNEDYIKIKESETKEKEILDPSIMLDILNRSRQNTEDNE